MPDARLFDLDEFLPYRLVHAGDIVSLEFYRHYRKHYGLTRPEWRVMAHLGQYGALTARDICERASLHKTKVSRAVASLEKRKWVRRDEDERDRRFEWLTLTAHGDKAYAALCEEGKRYNTALRARLGADGAATLLKLLDQLENRN